MTNAELIAKFKAEIERLKAKYRKDMYKSNHEGLASGYKIEAYNELLSFISSLESEKPINHTTVTVLDKYLNPVEITEDEKPMNLKGLEEEIERYFPESAFDTGWNYDDMQEAARHFAQWQYQKDRREFAKIKAKTWCEGFDACKEQMMENALHGWLDEDNEPPYDLNVVCEEKIPFGKFKHGDKVKLIIVKED